MKEKFLREILKEAQKKKQLGLFILSDWKVWDDLAFDVETGNENYNFALSQISKGEEATFYFELSLFSIPGAIAVPVQKLIASDEFFSQVINTCKENHFKGPIILIPSNECKC